MRVSPRPGCRGCGRHHLRALAHKQAGCGCLASHAADALLRPVRSQEARSLLKARKLGVATPVLYHVDTRASCLYMEFVPGMLVKERLFAGLDSAGAPLAQP
jgi:hypothetical protein